MNNKDILNSFHSHLTDSDQTVNMGRDLALCMTGATTIFLHGDLGAGKTTFTRGFVQALGHQGNVKSPTYTLVEPYEVADWKIYHFDLYRLADPEELEFMGIRDYFTDNSLCLIEWPQRGFGMLPQADIELSLTYVDNEREINFSANTDNGSAVLEALKQRRA
ncbi:tRNA (adenosine(37)-N6)-threonylcarbamoyltransferase complex ATPase subunit type 1 TsaE [Psychrobium sp. MM17-31]|uniref:tRNA (adenosine(37)-N6)-threonylcarbamoyltransferase complex ATPase subunit type 1 TsaE n=1 Tax=Psychrobium sp. MM17-31 TaxID=2917758 RepID=UPI0031BACA37